MAVAHRLRHIWLQAQGRFPLGAVEAAMALLERHGQRDSETEAELLARKVRENKAFAAEMDRLEAIEDGGLEGG